MTIKRSIEERSESLQIFLVGPNSYFLFDILMVQIPGVGSLTFNKFAGVKHIQFDEFLLIMETEMMEDVIFFFVEIQPRIQEGIFVKEILNLENIGGGEDELGYLLLVHR